MQQFPHFLEGLLYQPSHYWAVLKHRYFRPCRLAGTCRQKPELIGNEAVHKLQPIASTRSVWREPKATVPCCDICSMNKSWASDHRREFEIAADIIDHLGCYGEVTSLDFRQKHPDIVFFQSLWSQWCVVESILAKVPCIGGIWTLLNKHCQEQWPICCVCMLQCNKCRKAEAEWLCSCISMWVNSKSD